MGTEISRAIHDQLVHQSKVKSIISPKSSSRLCSSVSKLKKEIWSYSFKATFKKKYATFNFKIIFTWRFYFWYENLVIWIWKNFTNT